MRDKLMSTHNELKTIKLSSMHSANLID